VTAFCLASFVVAAATLGFGAPAVLVEGAAVTPFLAFSPVGTVFFLFLFLFLFLFSTTLHSSPSCSLGSTGVWATTGWVAGCFSLRRGSGVRSCCPPNRSSMALTVEGTSSLNCLSRASIRLSVSMGPPRRLSSRERRPASESDPLHGGHSCAQAVLLDNSCRRSAFSSSRADSLASTSLEAVSPRSVPSPLGFSYFYAAEM
jgi:hypothetical protein